MKKQQQSTCERKYFVRILKITFVLCFAIVLSAPLTTVAAPQHGFGQGHGRTDSVNENDFHTASWERIGFNYFFSFGIDNLELHIEFLVIVISINFHDFYF